MKTILSVIVDLDRELIGAFNDEAEAREWARQNLDANINPYIVCPLVDYKTRKSLKIKPEEKPSKILKEEKKEN